MEQPPSWEDSRFSSSQEIPRIVRNQDVQYRIHNSTPPASILSEINSIHAPSLFLKIIFNIVFQSTPRSSK